MLPNIFRNGVPHAHIARFLSNDDLRAVAQTSRNGAEVASASIRPDRKSEIRNAIDLEIPNDGWKRLRVGETRFEDDAWYKWRTDQNMFVWNGDVDMAREYRNFDGGTCYCFSSPWYAEWTRIIDVPRVMHFMNAHTQSELGCVRKLEFTGEILLGSERYNWLQWVGVTYRHFTRLTDRCVLFRQIGDFDTFYIDLDDDLGVTEAKEVLLKYAPALVEKFVYDLPSRMWSYIGDATEINGEYTLCTLQTAVREGLVRENTEAARRQRPEYADADFCVGYFVVRSVNDDVFGPRFMTYDELENIFSFDLEWVCMEYLGHRYVTSWRNVFEWFIHADNPDRVNTVAQSTFINMRLYSVW